MSLMASGSGLSSIFSLSLSQRPSHNQESRLVFCQAIIKGEEFLCVSVTMPLLLISLSSKPPSWELPERTLCQFLPLASGQGPGKGLICGTQQILRDDSYLFCIKETTPSQSGWHCRCIGESVNFIAMLTLPFSSFCPGKESQGRTPCRTVGNDFATDSATNFSRSGCVFLLPAIWIGSDDDKVSSKRHRRRSVTLAFIRANPCYKCFHKITKLTQPKLPLFLEVLPVVSDFKTTPIKQKTTEKCGERKDAMQQRGTVHAHLFFYFLVSRLRPSHRGVKEKQDQFVGRGDTELHLHVIACKIRENSQNFSMVYIRKISQQFLKSKN